MTVGQRALRGTIWLSMANYAAYAITFITDILLARHLLPEDFGTVALAVSVLEIVGRLGSFGIGTAIVQYRAEDKAQEQRFLSTLFSLQLIIAGGILLAILLVSAALLWLYEPIIIVTLLILAIGRTIQTVNQFAGALVQRRMAFRQDALTLFLSLGFSSSVSILLAWLGFGPWSLVGKRLSQILISGIGVWWIARWRPKLSWDREILRYVWRFARSIWVSGNLEVILKDLDDTAVGTVRDTESLGYYSRAYKLSQLFIEFIAPAIARTSLPTYSALKGDPPALASVFGFVQRFLARMSALFYIEIGLLSPVVVTLLYGEHWLPMVVLFRIMLVYAFLQPLFNQHKQLLIANERPHIVARVRSAQAAFFVPGVFVAAYAWGEVGVAVVVDVMVLIGIILIVWQTRKLVTFSLTRTILPSILGGLITSVTFWAFQQVWQPESSWLILIVSMPTIAIVFTISLFLSEGKTLLGDIWRVRRGLFRGHAGLQGTSD
jgi:O-antigen/teichoic acid export membrane protein